MSGNENGYIIEVRFTASEGYATVEEARQAQERLLDLAGNYIFDNDVNGDFCMGAVDVIDADTFDVLDCKCERPNGSA